MLLCMMSKLETAELAFVHSVVNSFNNDICGINPSCSRRKKAARVEVSVSLAFLPWVGIALHP